MVHQSIEVILTKAVEQRASDIHLTAGSPPIIRVDGSLITMGDEKVLPLHIESYLKEIMTDEMRGRLDMQRDLDFSFGVPRVSRFRVNAYYQRGTVAIAFRSISGEIPTMNELDLPQVLKRLIEKPYGLILVTGPTGSGKSTTLAAMIHEINRTQRKRIITLEDPIEYLHSHDQSIVDQREIGSDVMKFVDGLRAALRQDPDVILLGEMRDLETISTAMTAAETGHLVMATLHTSSAMSTVSRVIDAFPAEQQDQIRTQLANVLLGVVSQRLFPRVDVPKGRVAAMEIMIGNPAVANLIRNEKEFQLPTVIQTNRQNGMQTMDMAIEQLVRQGVINPNATPNEER
ncbi:type IV pilus twitching motility protein PilT [Exiguobacterium sp. SL-10]|uniref:type IV pilus twitching motility protein PilT n=1 Tax=unclassified Exiguobacterium TaxID=2644629 RepID=UPI00103B83E3|nr:MULTISPECIES: type IV pilus twitching motility protein PilT [unclassified Exiguobacterium]TCI23449.1 type IV pilus twitching motility protein PilT [Exiguobacterium sp. SL-9]TCI31605.1 type IV pilus twitching motility protein PilT [Exiguobacterium sp. SL-10]